METERRRQILLGVVTIVLVAVVYYEWPRTSADASQSSKQQGSGAAPASGSTAGSAAARQQARGGVQAPDVHLESLSAERPKPGPTDRNLFRFKPKAPPPPPPSARTPPPTAPAVPEGPPPPPALAPIQLKFIGVVEQGPGQPKIALLRDQMGNILRGAEGDVIEGRWRIVKIGVESIDMAYLDGRGRQTIRLTGT